MILLQSIVEVLAVVMPHTCAQHRSDRARITVMPIRGDPVGRDTGDHLRRPEKGCRGGHAAVLAEHDIDQRAGATDGTVGRTSVPVDLYVGFDRIPATAHLAASAASQTFSQCRCELGFPAANRLVTEYDTADLEHLRQITQGKLTA
jgi:hypothetical protein